MTGEVSSTTVYKTCIDGGKRMRQWVQRMLGLVMASAVLGCIVESPPPSPPSPPPPRPPGGVVECAPPHHMTVVDLDMIPDPVAVGQRVQLWRVTLQSDRNGECNTRLIVQDRNQTAGEVTYQVIRPGRAIYEVPAMPQYRFQPQDPCFRVLASIGRTYIPIDAHRDFCARTSIESGRWSLRP
jgi:hypothetical protein